ncbi:MAG: hypothetical protein GX100_02340, partial [candidate division WS1 bacterium]|nr:hypothetical protein [candidate division WS1 bacterium]
PWTAHEWGYEVLLYLAYAAAGWAGIICLQALMVGVTTLLAAYLAIRWGAALIPALVAATLLGYALGPWVNARPQMLDMIGVLVILHLLTSYQEGRPRALWWLPLVFLLWVNTHGAFPAGWVLVALYGLCRWLQSPGDDSRRRFFRLQPGVIKPLVLPLSAAIVVCLLNPNFLQGVLYPFTYLIGENAYYSGIVLEFTSPDFHQPAFLALEVLLLMTLVVMILSPRGASLFELVLVLGGSLIFLHQVRHGALLAVFCTPILAHHLSACLRTTRWPWLGDDTAAREVVRPPMAALALLVLLVLLVVVAPRSNAPDRVMLLDVPPTRATEVVRLNHFQGPMFNIYEWGGYLIWNLWPEYKVFVDGRADVYGKDLVNDYLRVYHQQPGWRETLKRYGVEWLMLKPGKPPATALGDEGEYVSVYKDGTAELFARKDGPNQRIIDLARTGRLDLPQGVVGPRP